MLHRNIYMVLLVLATMVITSCNNDKPTNKKEEQTTGTTSSFQPVELMDRNPDLSYDEYLKLKERYEKHKKAYLADNTKYDDLIKLAEIYVLEARITGEHPYYYSAALQALDEVLKHETKLTADQKFTALFDKATVELSQHNFNKALETGQEALAINFLNSGIYGVLVDANVEIGNYEAAVANCEKMMEIRPDLRSFSRTSYLREIYGEVAGSKEAMLRAIKAGAPYSEYKCWAIVTLGKIYEDHGHLDSALTCYDLATIERPNYPFGIAGKASVQAKKGDLAAAEKTYKRALEMLPEIGFNIDLAELKKQEGKQEEVDKMVEEIELMFTEDIESGHNMNLEYAKFLYTFKGDYKKALELGLEEQKNRPNNIDVNKLLAFVYYGMDDLDNAKKHAEVALKTGKQDAELMCISGLINSDKAAIKRSFEINPYQAHSFVKKAKTMI